MSNNKDSIEVPSFVMRRRETTDGQGISYQEINERTKRVSLDEKPMRVTQKRKRSCSLWQRTKRDLACLSLGAAVTLGGLAFHNADHIQDYFEQKKIVSTTLDDYYRTVIDPNRNMITEPTELGVVVPKLDENGDPLYWYNCDGIASSMKEMIDSGKSEEEVVYSTYACMVRVPDDIDDFYATMGKAGLNDEVNGWAIEHGYDSMLDSHLEKDAARMMTRNYKISLQQGEIQQMFDSGDEYSTTDKTLGGK